MKIGLSQRIIYHKGSAYDALDQRWYQYLHQHELVALPNRMDLDFDYIATTINAFIITGGDDSALRRAVELKMATSMLKQYKPIIGICHGCFLLQDILGGEIGEIDGHLGVDHPLYYFGERVVVNSHHSLYIKKLHKITSELAVDAEGHCEAWIDGNVAGVVWHPERMTEPWLPKEINALINS